MGSSGSSQSSRADLPGPDLLHLFLDLGQSELHLAQMEVEHQLRVVIRLGLQILGQRSRGRLVCLREEEG